jgi:mRNA interferase MazF
MPGNGGVSFPKRGDVFITSFDPAAGAEIQKTRPALILQNDIANQYGSITIVAAITSQTRDLRRPTTVGVRAPDGGLTADSAILLNQIRSIDKQRLIRRVGALKPGTMASVDRALRISLGLLKI